MFITLIVSQDPSHTIRQCCPILELTTCTALTQGLAIRNALFGEVLLGRSLGLIQYKR
jgi:hypothetical protein